MYDLRKPANQFVINLLYLLVWWLKIFGENAKAIAFNDEPSES
jgi:hypothetical protein